MSRAINTQTDESQISQKKNPLLLAALIHSKAADRVRQPNMYLRRSPSASVDLNHIDELSSQGLEVGFCLFKERLPELQEQKT